MKGPLTHPPNPITGDRPPKGREERVPAAVPAPGGRVGRRTGIGLFLLLFLTFGYFFQGGGWNQNGRFAQVRALAEERRFDIGDHLIYRRRPGDGDGAATLERVPLPPRMPLRKMADRSASGDLAFHPERREIYPVKPPGAALLAAPAYLAALGAERLLGLSPDHWPVLTFNAYWTGVFSVGLAGAALGLLSLLTARRLFPELPERARLAAALTLGLGTLVLPFSTALFDHVPTALWCLAAFHLVLVAGDGRRPGAALTAAGFAAGLAVVTNYLAAAVVVVLAVYALWRIRPRRQVLLFGLGGAPWALFLGWYHLQAFGTPLTVANLWAHGRFITRGQMLGAFGPPDPVILWHLLVSEHRGLLFTSPVLALSVVGLWWMARRRRLPEVLLILSVFVSLWLVDGAFNYWHGGWTIGPRFLIPALPFLALALVPVFHRLPAVATIAALVSAALLLLATAVDMQPPPEFEHPYRGYLLPLAAGAELDVARATVSGRVSVNPIGFYEGWFYTVYPRGSYQAHWNSFNLGELLWPGSFASLLPLGLLLGAGVPLLLRSAATGRSTRSADVSASRTSKTG